MSSDTDTSSSLSSGSTNHKKSKSIKKRKRKSERKHKRREKKRKHDEKKHAKRNSIIETVSAGIAPENIEITAEDAAFGPALPPHLQQKQLPLEKKAPTDVIKIIGPTLPANFLTNTAAASEVVHNLSENLESDHSDDIFGPTLARPDEMNRGQIELEQRALELKLAAISGPLQTNVDQEEREEWMLELPEVGLKTGLAALANMKRTFHQGKERPDFSDRSSWTKTPNVGSEGKQKPTNSKKSAESLKTNAQALYERQRDEEQAHLAKKHKKKHKRDESLVDLHQKQRRKEQRKREKELAAAGVKPERRPFSRDVDLKLNKIDKNQTKQIVDKAKILNTKFSSGQAKYL